MIQQHKHIFKGVYLIPKKNNEAINICIKRPAGTPKVELMLDHKERMSDKKKRDAAIYQRVVNDRKSVNYYNNLYAIVGLNPAWMKSIWPEGKIANPARMG